MNKEYLVEFETVNRHKLFYRIITDDIDKIEEYLTNIYLIPKDSEIKITEYNHFMEDLEYIDRVTI